ncbi:MAG: M48 family metalloprotease [Acidobacteriota bacterium]|nr:M48 family metalloprotease [Acidobacteriota bacterium]
MSILRVGRAKWFFAVLLLATPMLMPLSGSARTKPRKAKVDEPESAEVAAIVNRVIATEKQYNQKLKDYSPRVETYLQYYQPDKEFGDRATKDDHFLGRLQLADHEKEVSFIQDSFSDRLRRRPEILRAHLHLNEFAVEPLTVDQENFDREHYAFEPVRWEYLGDLRCLAIDVRPKGRVAVGSFEGRIWVEDQSYAIVRLNGNRIHPPRMTFYVHFDCWRENLQPGLWLPVYIYSQESDLGKRLRYKAETRLWGYDLTSRRQQQEWTNIQVEAPVAVRDRSEVTSDLSPVESQRLLNVEAERNVLDRLEKARLIAPPGPVDKVLETVVNNLKVTNHLDNIPPVQCRVMLTSNLESFSLAYTIVLSRGLIDVLPDEPSLAMILAHELAHIALGHKLDTKYAFNDRLQMSDEKLLANLDLARDHKDEAAADAKGIELLKNSPYQDKLGQAGLFLRAAVEAEPHVHNIFGAHLGNGLAEGNKLVRMTALISASPALTPKKVDQIAALPLGSRIQVNAWDGSIAFTTRKAVPIVDASEKLPFRVTPVIPYLRIFATGPKVEASAQN